MINTRDRKTVPDELHADFNRTERTSGRESEAVLKKNPLPGNLPAYLFGEIELVAPLLF